MTIGAKVLDWAKEKAKKPERKNNNLNNKFTSLEVAVITAAFLFFININVYSSINGFIELNSGYDDNPFYEEHKTPGYNLAPSFGIGYFPDSLDIGISANARYMKFTEFNARNYLFLNLLASYSYSFDEYTLGINSSYNTRRNYDEISIFSYDQFIANINLNIKDVFEISFVPRKREYFNNTSLSYVEHKLIPNYYIKLSVKQALFMEAEVSAKLFTDRINTNDQTEEPEPNKGKGKMARRKVGNIYEPGIINIENDAYLSNLFISYIQNIDQTTGFSLGMNMNIPLYSNNAAILPGTAEINEDPDLFDDAYSFTEFSPQLTFNKLLFKDYLVSFNTSYSFRDFIYDVDSIEMNNDNSNRQDHRINISIDISRSIKIDVYQLNFELEYINTNNTSNIDIYNFNNNMLIFSTRFTY
jgi:hypothetical protein